MAETTGIEWCDSTFNPWIGCTRVSPACDDCYAARSTPARTLGVPWGPGQPRRRTTDATWGLPMRWQRNAEAFQAQHGRRQRVFCASLADWLDNEVPVEWLVDLLQLIHDTPALDWLLLSKRIGNFETRLREAREHVDFHRQRDLWLWITDWYREGKPPHNVWIMATVVNQPEADRDIGKLLRVPARVRGLSIEPMLGPIDLQRLVLKAAEHPERGEPPVSIDALRGWHGGADGLTGIDWVICGGESGPKARPMQIGWARSLMQQCKAAGVAFHMKQLGAQPRGWCAARLHMEAADRADGDDADCDLYEAHECGRPCERCVALSDKKGGDMAEWPEDLRVREFPSA